MADNKFHTGRILKNMEALKTTLPPIMANHAQNYFVDSWKRGGWEGKKWALPQRKIEGTYAYKFASPAARSRATLIKSGALRRAVGMSIRSRTFEKIQLIVGLPYAQRHNDGDKTMPARTFMKDSRYLRAQQTRKIHEQIDKAWKS